MKTHTYQSLSELLEDSRPYRDDSACADDRSGFAGCKWSDVDNWLAHGWHYGLVEATEIAESAINLITADQPLMTFETEYGVTGSEVDIARYLTGQPENMLEYLPITVSRAGKVISVCVSCSVSGAVSAKGIIKRGAAIVGLCLALEKTQHATEIWLDLAGTPFSSRKADQVDIRVLVKGAHDVTDPGVLAFVLGHPGMLRKVMFAALLRHGCSPSSYKPVDPPKTLPDGTIYLPCLLSVMNVPDPQTFITDSLRELGLLQ